MCVGICGVDSVTKFGLQRVENGMGTIMYVVAVTLAED